MLESTPRSVNLSVSSVSSVILETLVLFQSSKYWMWLYSSILLSTVYTPTERKMIQIMVDEMVFPRQQILPSFP